MNDAALAKIEKLERSKRWSRRWLFVLTVTLVFQSLMPIKVVRNPFGGSSITSSALETTAIQAFSDADGLRRLELGSTPGGPALFVLGRDGKPRIALSSTERGDKDIPLLRMVDDDESPASFQVDLLDGGRPRVVMLPPEGKGRIELGFDADGNPRLRLVDRRGLLLFETPDPSSAASGAVQTPAPARP